MPSDIITLTTLTYMRAQLLCAMLERNGIECFMTNINRMKETAGGVNVNINAADIQKAISIFKDFSSAYGKEKERAVEYMKSIRRILVPLDFSSHSENAAIYALNIASKLKADVKLINAYLDPVGAPNSYLESFAFQTNINSIISEVEEETATSLNNIAGKLKQIIKEQKIHGVNIEYDLFRGNSHDVILNELNEYNPGLMIMGTRGAELEGFKSFGSITSGIISKSSIPVIAVPKMYNASSFEFPDRILYITNFDNTDFAALRKLSALAKPFNSKIFCVHTTEAENNLGEMEMKKIKRYMFDTIGSFKFDCQLIKTDDMMAGIDGFAEENGINMLAVTRVKRPFFEQLFKKDIGKRFLFHSQIPLFVFNPKPE